MINRLYREDCKTALQTLIDEGIRVDLIYLDPPFNSSRIYNILFRRDGVQAQQKAFDDMWRSIRHSEQLQEFERFLDHQSDLSSTVRRFLHTWIVLMSEESQDQTMLTYLIYMTERLILLKRILKATGSIYYHCDPTASHYIKIIMDQVFGRKNFQNEIVWCYTGPSGAKKNFPRKHDVILRYTKSDEWVFNTEAIRIPYKRITGQGKTSIVGNKLTDKRLIVEYEKRGKVPPDFWLDIGSGSHISSKERLGYPTQKPLKLLDRIIKASSNQYDIVLDPFCGCGTALVSAHHLNRKWIGIDLSGYAIDEVTKRLAEYCSLLKTDYQLIEGSPETLLEYNRLTPYEKQDWLIRRLGGHPNLRKSGDKGIDGELTIHLGTAEGGKHLWGKLIFSVKTGTQRTPAMIRELLGTMTAYKAEMGVLILDSDPTSEMEKVAEKAGTLCYQPGLSLPMSYFSRIQILTAREIIANATLSCPYTMLQIKTAESSLQHNLFGVSLRG